MSEARRFQASTDVTKPDGKVLPLNHGKWFLSIDDAARETGLSVYFFRKGVRDRTIPYIRTGCKAMINMRLLPEALNRLMEGGNNHAE